MEPEWEDGRSIQEQTLKFVLGLHNQGKNIHYLICQHLQDVDIKQTYSNIESLSKEIGQYF